MTSGGGRPCPRGSSQPDVLEVGLVWRHQFAVGELVAFRLRIREVGARRSGATPLHAFGVYQELRVWRAPSTAVHLTGSSTAKCAAPTQRATAVSCASATLRPEFCAKHDWTWRLGAFRVRLIAVPSWGGTYPMYGTCDGARNRRNPRSELNPLSPQGPGIRRLVGRNLGLTPL